MFSSSVRSILRGVACAAVIGSACSNDREPGPEVLVMEPARVSTLAPAAGIVLGRRFLVAVTTTLGDERKFIVDDEFRVTIGSIELPYNQVEYVDKENLKILLPAGLPLGFHDVTVMTPRGHTATLEGGLEVVADAIGLTLQIESAAGGVGNVVTNGALMAGETLVLHAVYRDAWDAFAADATVSWSATGGAGLFDAGPATSTSFLATTPGVAAVTATAPVGQVAVVDPITVIVGPAVALLIHDAPDETGLPVDARQLVPSDQLTLYAKSFDALGNPVAAELVGWTVVNTTGGPIGTIPAGPSSSAIFTAGSAGSGIVRATHGTLGTADTGTIIVTANGVAFVKIETAAGGLGVEVTTASLTVGVSLPLFAAGYAVGGNYLGDIPVTWSITGDAIGTLSATNGTQTTLTVDTAGIGQIVATPALAAGDSTGDITVVDPVTVTQISVETAAGGVGTTVAVQDLPVGQSITVYAIGRDAGNSYVADFAVDWTTNGTLVGTFSVVNPSTSVTFTPTTIGQGKIKAADPAAQLASAITATITATAAASCIGNGIETGELCDGIDLGGVTCVNLGFQPGGTGLLCNGTCNGYITTGCIGSTIATVADLNTAIDDAYATPGHDVIELQPGIFDLGSVTLDLDGCPGVIACGTPDTDGITLQPAGAGKVVIRASGADAIFLNAGNNKVIGLRIEVSGGRAIRFLAGSNNLVKGNHIIGTGGNSELLKVDTGSSVIEGNRFENLSGGQISWGVHIKAPGTVVKMNVIQGDYRMSLRINGIDCVVDNNSVWTPPGGVGITLEIGAPGTCVRNNIVFATGGGGTGWDIAAGLIWDTGAGCGAVPSQNNVEFGNGTACVGDAARCTAVVDLAVDPGFTNSEMCLNPTATALIDTATVLGYDMLDNGNAPSHNGAGPEIGARESGATRVYGGTASSCP